MVFTNGCHAKLTCKPQIHSLEVSPTGQLPVGAGAVEFNLARHPLSLLVAGLPHAIWFANVVGRVKNWRNSYLGVSFFFWCNPSGVFFFFFVQYCVTLWSVTYKGFAVTNKIAA